MRIMVIGAKAAGKSSFSKKLSEKLSLPLIRIDAIVNSVGRSQKAGELIRKEADKPDWVMDGNSFTRDRSYRLEKADYIVLFTQNRFKSLFMHIKRWLDEKRSKKRNSDGRSEGLHLWFAISFALWRWPKREKEIIEHSKSLHKKVILVKNYAEADALLIQFKQDW